MITQFLPPNHPLLTKNAEGIPKTEINSEKINKVVKQMFKIAYGEQKNKKKPTMVGLAAPQIGILKRIILIDIKANGKGKVGDVRVYINPQITWISQQNGEWYEGCYSTGKVCGIVSRPTSIKIKAYTQGGKIVLEKHKGYIARIFQHEIDHLNGRVFVDRIKDSSKLHWVLKREFPLYRNKQAWRNWPNKCSFEKWEKIKNS